MLHSTSPSRSGHSLLLYRLFPIILNTLTISIWATSKGDGKGVIRLARTLESCALKRRFGVSLEGAKKFVLLLPKEPSPGYALSLAENYPRKRGKGNMSVFGHRATVERRGVARIVEDRGIELF